MVFAIAIAATNVTAEVYQWSIPIESKDSQSRAFLWVPPNCRYVRGVVLANQVILEKKVCDDASMRAACVKEGLAIILIFKGPLTAFNYKDGGEDRQLQKIFDDLALESGYSEISVAPIFTIGHSGGGIGAWNIGYWKPNRVFGILTLHSAAMVNPPNGDSKANISGIPVMAVSGENEMWKGSNVPIDQHWRWLRGDLLDIRGKYVEPLVCEVVQPGAGHFNFDSHLAKLTAMFLQKAAHYRIPTGNGNSKTPVTLNHIDEQAGWLTDISFLTPSKFPPTVAKKFKGDPSLAFWSLDEEMAKALESFPSFYGGKTDQRVTFIEDDKVLPAKWITDLKFKPLEDGLTFKVKATFLKETPEGVAGAGKLLGHSSGPIKFSLIGGWAGGGEQIGPDTFRIKFDHRFTNNIMVMAYNEGDVTYKFAEQAGQVKFPENNKEGLAQTITFTPIDNVTTLAKSITLKAVSSLAYPVYYNVISGPAEIKGDHLFFTSIPPNSKYPLKVIITAYQWGRSIEPLVQSARPVEQIFYINK